MLRLAILVSIAAPLVLAPRLTLADGPAQLPHANAQPPRANAQPPVRLPTIQLAKPLATPAETLSPETLSPADAYLPPVDRYLSPPDSLPPPTDGNLSAPGDKSILIPNLRTPALQLDHGLSTAPDWQVDGPAEFSTSPLEITNSGPGEFIVDEQTDGELIVADRALSRRRTLADHWTPWHQFRHQRRQPGFLRKLADMAWQTSGRARSATGDLGIGHERVMFAPSVVETAISTANVGVQWQLDRGLQTPDRAAFYWGPPPLGPGFDARVNTFDTRLRMELGNERLMAITDFTMRSLDPTSLENTTGIGDLQIGAKALLVDGKRLKLSTIFRTYLPTGVERKGLGTGHTSLEPGLLFRYCLSPRTFAFGEFKYWIPLGADPQYAGDVMTTGFAISTILRESDVYAFMPTFEVRTLSFLFGGRTLADGTVARIDGETAVEIYPGARLVLGPAGDTGLWELNVAGGVSVGDDQWFDSRVIFGLRWNY
ncbi:transporter [Planctomycetaceae bacterium SH139]